MVLKQIKVPDIGSTMDVDVIEILVKPGDDIQKEDSLITLESEKATMEIPSPEAGIIKDIKIAVGDKVNTDSLILEIEVTAVDSSPTEPERSEGQTQIKTEEQAEAEPQKKIERKTETQPEKRTNIHAGPAVRRIAREFGIDLTQISATGNKNRILKEDIQAYVKAKLAGAPSTSIPTAPAIDFSKYGDIETQPLNKIKKLTGINVHRSWITVPHVTQFDEADITEMEIFRKDNKAKAEAIGAKLTPLVFIMKAVVAALKAFPTFNSSLDPSGANLILKKYFHIGVAVETPNGLVVPVIRDVDQKGFLTLAKELGDISSKAREKGLMPADMAGSCFTISSLGGIGGTAFTPIVKTPDVAILGVSKSSVKPIYTDDEFHARLILPLSLSYDHRVIDGAEAARFTRFLASSLTDIRTLLL